MGHSLVVYFGPSEADRVWRDAVEAVALSRGWTLNWPEASEGEISPGDERFILKCSPPDSPDADGIDSVAILVHPTITDRVSCEDATTLENITRQSEWLARCAQLESEGASIIDGNEVHITLPKLGDVVRAPLDAHHENIEPCLGVYAEFPLVHGAKARWRASLFHCSSRGSRVVAGDDGLTEIDLTGRAGPLISGPYIHLPKGRWRLKIVLEIDPQGGASQLAFDWGDNHHRVYFEAAPNVSGIYEVLMETIRHEAWCGEFRIISLHPHFKGKLRFSGCDIEYVCQV